ncbi:ABC transporter permease [Agromyces atrinae]|uniref:ABC transporter permease n=1 Tax=Agromyces atrinae TaxID=592376 RepID=A0A4Q2M6Y7_9MICO|nr:ABC transporter permease [Agromyces atrinae]NYD68070.1 peptide/nickel transport system permease protein [Agromyces atrinae]RXZ87779.1 ABC transporter permease [Agromyces atrinae]
MKLARYLVLRFAQAILVLWVTFTIVFLAIASLPSDPVTIYLATDAGGDPELIEQLRSYYGYDRPWYEQYAVQLGNLLRGDFGFSLSSGQPVLERIGDVIGSTLALAGTALLIAIIFSLLIAAGAYLLRSRRIHGTIVAIPSFFSAVPVFWLGIIALGFFSFQLRVLSLFPDGSFLSLVIPAAVLAIPVSAPIAQVLVTSGEQSAELPFVKTARAKGAAPGRVFRSHVLRSSLGPAVTVVSTAIGVLVAGAVITETVFARPGLGSVLLKAVVAQDIPLVQGLVFLSTLVVVIVSLIVDVLLPVIDPRVLRGRLSPGVPRLAS